MRLATSVIFLFLIYYPSLDAQAKKLEIYPEVGKICPDYLLRNIEYFPKHQCNIRDYRNKWLVLDFWSKNCSSCVESFPKINGIAEKLQDKVQFIMVGREDKEGQIRAIYKRFRDKLKLHLACSFDSLIFKQLDILQVPYIIIIDQHGIVQAITSSITYENIEAFLAGKQPALKKAYRTHQVAEKVSYNPQKPFLIDGNGGIDTNFLFRSILAKWTPEMEYYIPGSIAQEHVRRGKFEVLGQPIYRLYNYAFLGVRQINCGDTLYGKYYGYPIIESSDSLLIYSEDSLYCFSIILPKFKSSLEYIKKIMQNELETYFGYSATIEKRRMPYWRLVADEDAKIKLKSKGDSTYFKSVVKSGGFAAKNFTIEKLIKEIYYSNYHEPPILNETGINFNIDISMDCIFTDMNEIEKCLEGNGLHLEKGEKDMNVIVLRNFKRLPD